MEDWKAEIQQSTNEELVKVCNQPRHNTEEMMYASLAYNELVRRGKEPSIIGYDAYKAPVYALMEG